VAKATQEQIRRADEGARRIYEAVKDLDLIPAAEKLRSMKPSEEAVVWLAFRLHAFMKRDDAVRNQAMRKDKYPKVTEAALRAELAKHLRKNEGREYGWKSAASRHLGAPERVVRARAKKFDIAG
jgi:hypothetical protein